MQLNYHRPMTKGGNILDFSDILLAVDCDGTLLRKDKSISDADKDAIAYFRSMGGNFTIVTGRSIPTARTYMDELHITMPVVLYNGAMVYDPIISAPLKTSYLPETSKRAVTAVTEHFGDQVGIEVLCEDGELYAICYNDLVHTHLAVRQTPHIRCDFETVRDMKWIKVLFAVPEEEKPPVCAFLDTLSVEEVRFVHSANILYEMLPMGADKGSALGQICRLTGIPPEKTAAMGDYNNDLELLEFSHFSIAPKTACDAVKKIAKLLVSSNEENAVSEAIRHIMLHKDEIFSN